eukprot:CAMPEP_0198197076 /NCGR_PEP_ID=MMETSP1445-20131203/651_1 /TAXON_ID=36898 /ORGANISM="Pyramimonas sp., Strain CCMP2087" /LENGTH=165 /DNA_ID=CAMNT_0043866225 /DNA_START=216 /DNA_END=713 /DNA_ORIENTATION=-
MIRAANVMGIPVVVTEQYPERFGSTSSQIASLLKPACKAIPKTTFSMVTADVDAILAEHPSRTQILLTGIEAQVCVFQTALDLLARDYEVHVLVDGVSSSRTLDRNVGISRMAQHGAFMSCYEMALLQLMRDSKAPHFKAISELLKETRPEPELPSPRPLLLPKL